MTIRSGSNDEGNIYFSDGSSGGTEESRGIIRFDHADDSLKFFTATSSNFSAQRMIIASAGNIGINTSNAPHKLLEVADDGGETTVSISTDEVPGSQSSKRFLNLDFTGYNNLAMARIQSWDESSSTGQGYLTFHTRLHNTGVQEAMRISFRGDVKIGHTSSNQVPLEVRRDNPGAGQLFAIGSNGTHCTTNAGGVANALTLFRVRVEVQPNTTTDLVSGYGGRLVLNTMVNNGGDDVQQTRVRTHAWSTSTSLFFNTYGSNQPTVTFSVGSGVLKVNHNHTGNIFFNCAGFIITGPQSQ